jgi:hypothetical protein
MKQLLILILMGGAALACTPAFADTCSGDISNQTLKKLEVTATCFGDNVTVDGGVVVNPGASLQLTNSTVRGGINVNGGSLILPTAANHGRNDIDGGIVMMYNSSVLSALALFDSDINGQLSISGLSGGSSSGGGLACGKVNGELCNLKIDGGLTLSNSDSKCGKMVIGTSLASCPGSKIYGGVILDNSVVGSLFNNTVKGGLFCINGGAVSNKANNNIAGKITCAGF